MLRRLTVLAVLVLALAGCGSDDETASTTPETTAAATTEASGFELKVGLVTDIGGLDDRSFNFLANQGLDRAEDELGVDGRVLSRRRTRITSRISPRSRSRTMTSWSRSAS